MPNTPEADAQHWVKTRTLTYTILGLWAIFAIAAHVFADWLNQVTFLGFPLGHYMAVQGSLIAFVVLIFLHNWGQDSIDEEFGHDD